VYAYPTESDNIHNIPSLNEFVLRLESDRIVKPMNARSKLSTYSFVNLIYRSIWHLRRRSFHARTLNLWCCMKPVYIRKIMTGKNKLVE